MADQKKQPIGSIGWRDLTVENAPALRDFLYGRGWVVR